MTHFIGAVIVPASVTFHVNTYPTKWPDLYGPDAREFVPGTELQEFLARALAPFDENRPYEAWIPKDEIIAEKRAEIERYRTTTYATYLEDPEKYARGVTNMDHLEYLRTGFPEKLTWTDEQVYADALKWEDAEDIREDGAVRTRYNPESKWDWYTIGGRWEKTYRDRQGEKILDFRAELVTAIENARDPEAIAELALVQANVDALMEIQREEAAAGTQPRTVSFQDVDKAREKLLDCRAYFPWWTPYNIVTTTMQDPELGPDDEAVYDENGEIVKVEKFEWVTKGRVGWWGMHDDNMDDIQWAEKLIEILDAQDPESKIVYIDFHI